MENAKHRENAPLFREALVPHDNVVPRSAGAVVTSDEQGMNGNVFANMKISGKIGPLLTMVVT